MADNGTPPVELYRKHRPSLWKQVVGQAQAVKLLEGKLKEGTLPHAILLTGPSGVGKTTIARILKNKLNCGDNDFAEINCAKERGIDMARDISSRMSLSPWGGKESCRIWLLDECFHKDTLIDTPYGQMPISSLNIGDSVFNISGHAVVNHVFVNKVPLSRVVKISLSNGFTIYTTKEHKFLTDNGWIEAQNLHNRKLYARGELGDEQSLTRDLQPLQKPIYNECFSTREVRKRSRSFLFQKLSIKLLCCQKGSWQDIDQKMSILWNTIQNATIEKKGSLFPILCCKGEKQKASVVTSVQEPKTTSKAEPKYEILSFNISWKGTSKKIIASNEIKQPLFFSRGTRKNKADKGEEWNSPRLVGGEGGQWQIYSPTNKVMEGFRAIPLEEGASDPHQGEVVGRVPIPNQLQGRYWQEGVQTSHRNRWQWSQIEKSYIERCKENPMSGKVRVDSVEVYQQGYNDKSFLGIISHKEKTQGFVEFYDLEIHGHPSYFVNGFPVHNCHRLTGDSQASLLKMLEDTPNHVYFFLCTTDPRKILDTIVTRCTVIQLSVIADSDMKLVIHQVCDKEGVKLSDNIVDQLVDVAGGSARKALVELSKIITLPPEQQLAAISQEETKKQAFDILKALLYVKPSEWKVVADLLKSLDVKEEPERLRHYILAAATTELLKGNKNAGRAYAVICAFESEWFNCKESGLARACYEVLGR